MASDSPTPETVEADLIDALTYEDDHWLWEPIWILSGRYPNLTESEKVGLARQVVLGLAQQQRVTLWKGQWPDGSVEPLT